MKNENENRCGPGLKKLLLISVPAVILIFGTVILYRVWQLKSMREETQLLQSAVQTVTAEINESAPAQELFSPDPASGGSGKEQAASPVLLGLTAGSSADCINAEVISPEGSVPAGFVFPVRIIFPDGSERNYSTDGDGRLFVSGLSAGIYKLSLSPVEGFDTSCAVSCTVEGLYSYTPIENISQQAVVTQASEAPDDEPIPASANTEAVAAELIVTAQTTDQAAAASADADIPANGIVIVSGTSPDEPSTAAGSAVATWKYSFLTGPGGNILKADGTESDVFPVLENGTLSYGLRKIVTYLNADGQAVSYYDIPEEAAEGVDYFVEESSEYVTLIFGDGSFNTDYSISASQVAEEKKIVSGWQEIDGKQYYIDASGSRVTGLKNIDGELSFFNADGSKKGKLGVDVSYWNHDINFYAVKNNGIDFAIVRVGYRGYESGKLYEDGNSYKEMDSGGCYLQEAAAAGLGVGAYFYSSAVNTNEAVEEASLAIEVLKASGVSPDYPVYIDMEDSGMFPDGRADKLTPAERTEIINAFCLTVSAAGYTPGLYCSELYYYYRIDSAALTDCSLWIANYSDYFTLPGINGWDVWQFTPSAMISGIAGGSDLNVLAG